MIAWLRQHRDALVLAARRLAAAPANTLLSVLAIGVALALPAGGQMLLGSAQALLGKSPARPQLSVFMALDAERKATLEVEARLRRMAGVAQIVVVAREATLARMKSGQGLGEALEALPANPFPDALVVTPRDERPHALEGLAAELRRLPGVEHVQLDSAWVQRLEALLRLVRTAVAMLALLLGIGLVAITFNAIRLQLLASGTEIEVSRLLGATEAFVSRPYYWFGALLGLMGGSMALLIVHAAAVWLRAPLADLASLYRLDLVPIGLGGRDGLALLGIASTLGWLGAALSIRRG